MKILLLAENWEPRIGGIERYLKGMAGALESQGVQVEVVSPRMKRFFWPLVKPSWLPLFIFLWRKAKRGDFRVLIAGKALFEGLVGYYLKRHLGIPYVVCTYAMEIETWSATRSESRKLRRVLQNADRVLYINEVTKKKLLELGVAEKQLLKVKPGIHPVKSRRSGITGQASPSRYILSVGRLVARKGFDTLIDAFAKLDQTKFGDVELWIAGDGPERETLTRLAKENFVEGSVKFLGAVSDEELAKLYAGAEVFALTPKEIGGDLEGFGIVYLEAASYGVPAIGTRTGGVPEAVIHNETGLLATPNDSQSVAIVLMQLLANQELRDRLGKQAQMRVQEEFSWHKQIQALTEALKAITE